MGSGNSDYRNQIDSALRQSNMPKSPLSQQYNDLFGSTSPGLFNSLLNVQNLGNSFINSGKNGGGYTPGTATQSKPYGSYTAPGGTASDVAKDYWTGVFNQKNKTPGSDANTLYAGLPANTSSASSGATSFNPPTIAGYQGGFTPVYGSIGGVDITPYQGKGLTFNDLVSRGILTSDQVKAQIGVSSEWDPTKDQGVQKDYKNYHDFYKSQNPGQPGLSFDDYFKNFGYGGTNIDAWNPNDEAGFQTALGNLPKDSQTYDPIANPPRFLVGGNFLDQFGNITGVNGPGGIGGGFSAGMGGSVNVSQTGMPQGIEIPGVSNAPGLVGMSNVSPQILQLLSKIGFNPSQVSNQNINNQQVNNPNFNQQQLNPGQATSNFNPTQADLSGVASGTQLTPENSQYMNAVSQILNQQFGKNVADTRERALDTGTARSTGASYDEAQLKAAQLPQLVAALNQIRQPEVANQLQSAGLQQQGLLQNAGLQNQYGLGGAQLDTSTQLQNISNLINSGNLNNLTSLQARGQDVGTALANASNNLGAQSSNASNNLSAQSSNQNAGLQNQGLNFNLLNQLLGTQLGQQGLVGQNNQFNAGANNAYNLAVGGLNQQAAQQSIQNQLQALMTLFGGGLSLAGAGQPGGSASVNIGNGQQSNGIGSSLGGLGALLSALGNFR